MSALQKQIDTHIFLKTLTGINPDIETYLKKTLPLDINSLPPEDIRLWLAHARREKKAVELDPTHKIKAFVPVSNEFLKSNISMPKIRHGRISAEELMPYVMTLAGQRGMNITKEQLQALLKRRDWQALTANEDPWEFYPLIVDRTDDILAGL